MRSIRTVFGVLAIVGAFVIAGLACVLLNAQAQGADLLIGTWKADVVKSKSPNRSQTIRYEKLSDGSFKRTQDTVNAQGQSAHQEITFKLDGKDYPVQGGTPGAVDAWRQVDARTIESVSRLNGKVLTTTRRVISADGKSMVTTQTGTNAQGLAVNNTIYTTKQ